MKKLIAFTLVLLLSISLFGCGNKNVDTATQTKDTKTETQVQQDTITPTQSIETYAQKENAPTLPEGAITSEDAVTIALDKAGVTKSQLIGLWSELDYDDGVLIYEVDFSDGKYDYDCDVDALNGKVLKFEKELDD